MHRSHLDETGVLPMSINQRDKSTGWSRYRYSATYVYYGEHNPFPEFSIPLYGLLKKEDEEEIVKIVSDKAKIKKN